MDRKFFTLLSSLLLASGLAACTYDDGGVENQNGNKYGEGDDAVICSFKCPTGYFCDGKSKGCVEVFAPGVACEDNAMCKSGACVGKVCTCNSNDQCPDGKECNAGVCGSSTSTAKKVGESCATTDECVSTAFCDIVTNTCKAYAKGGEACTSASECLSKSCEDGLCGCKESADCKAGNVCDAGTCREVMKCPNNGAKKCFKALELSPKPSWSIGKIDAADGDYAGSSFDFYLPNNGVVTCIYPTLILEGAQQAVVMSLNSFLKSMNIDALPSPKSYCAPEQNVAECAERSTPGCYMVNADEHIPFTFVERADSPWAGRTFYTDFTVSAVNFDTLSRFQLALAPAYSIEDRNKSFASNANAAKSFFPGVSNVPLVVKYEPEKCAKQSNPYFMGDSVSGSENLVACQNTYQIMMEVTYRSSDTAILCDNILMQSSNGSIPKETKDQLKAAVDAMADDNPLKATMASMLPMITEDAPICFKTDCEKTTKEATDLVSAVKQQMFSTNNTIQYEPEKYYGYPGPMVNGGDYIWHNCRAGDIMFNKLTVYVELNDTDKISE